MKTKKPTAGIDPAQTTSAIDKIVATGTSATDYISFTRSLFEITLAVPDKDPVWAMLDYLETETDFYTAPASTRFHNNEPFGLVRHSLSVLANGLRLAPVMLGCDVDYYHLSISCLLHDFCKVNMYEATTRNVKNEKTGVWEKVPAYKVREDYMSFGHGIESMLRLSRFIQMPEAWNHAIRWHMGAYDLSPTADISHKKALAKYREVLFLQTADMQAGLVDEVRGK
jgi:hypothetical protein